MRQALLAAALLLGGCAGRRAARPAAPEPAVSVLVDEDGPWQEVDAEDEVVVATLPPEAPPAPEVRVEVAAPAAPALALPERRATPAPRPAGAKPAKSPEDMARERFLDHPTRIRAATITFYCPRRFAGEVRMQGEELTDPRPGRRIAKGGAHLICRELTLDADRIVLRIQEEDDAAVQVTARGDASFVTDQRGQVLHHDHVRILVITNDGVTPLK